jgi:cytochrome c oxidase accessory protein FixG
MNAPADKPDSAPPTTDPTAASRDVVSPDSPGGMVLSTLNEDGSRRWIKPRPSRGAMHARRRAVAIGLVALFTMLPHVEINEKPAILLDLAARRFTFFGVTLLPNDTLPFAMLMVSLFLALFFVTAIFGRLWCGWACPQTVYMEFLFRPLERFFDGTPGRAVKGSFRGSPLATTLKYATYLVVACFLSHTFLAYFVGVDTLAVWVRRSPLEHPASFLVMLSVVALMMFDFCFFREQTCIVACPYGRFQSVLLDRFSWIVAYDPRRGEPRGKAAKGRDVSLPVVQAARGDCVDCGLCVATCPTGIDIRNGLQMECIHCTQCIDACDGVMTRLGRSTGLIRYASQAELAGELPKGRFKLRPRLVVYPALVLGLVVAAFTVLALRGPVSASVFRTRGATFAELPGGIVTNPVGLRLINRLDTPVTYTLAASPKHASSAAHLRFPAETATVTLEAGEARVINTLVEADAASFVNGSMPIVISILDRDGRAVAERPYNLLGPMARFADPASTPPARTAPHGTDRHEPRRRPEPDRQGEQEDRQEGHERKEPRP